MKSSKKRPSKRYSNMSDGNPIIEKLLKLKYRINDAYRSGLKSEQFGSTKDDKNYVMTLISDVREHDIRKLSAEDGLKCNSLWRVYEAE